MLICQLTLPSDVYNFDKLSMGSGGGERFTEYSVSSSVLPRGEGLTMLDDKFEQVKKRRGKKERKNKV